MDLKYDGKVWTEFVSLRVGTSGGLMWTSGRRFGFHNSLGIF